MKNLISIYFIITASLLGLLPLCAYAEPALNIQVSILPQKYFVDKIGMDRVKVDVLVKPGKSPATYSPSPDQMKRLVSSDVYFRIGVPFENGILQRIKAVTSAKIVDTRQGIALREMEEHDHDAKDHARNVHMGKDPHIWMSPVLVKQQAHTIYSTLSSLDPAGKDVYKKNHDEFIAALDALDLRLKSIFKDLQGENLFVFHPSFGYFTDAYGLRQIAVEAMGKAPRGKTISRIIKQAKKQKTRVIFVQPQFDRNSANKIASAINGAVVSIDPLAYDYLANMENMANTIAKALNK